MAAKRETMTESIAPLLEALKFPVQKKPVVKEVFVASENSIAAK
jgi:hypothetical protein